MNKIRMKTKRCGEIPAKIIAEEKLMSGEINYYLAITEYGGLWVKGDWTIDKHWIPYGYKALEKDHPSLFKKLNIFLEVKR